MAPGVRIAIGLLLDLLWWWVAHRSAKRAGWKTAPRVFLALFAVAQGVWLVDYLRVPALDLTPAAPNALDHAGMAWHLILVPLTLLGAGAAGLLRKLRK